MWILWISLCWTSWSLLLLRAWSLPTSGALQATFVFWHLRMSFILNVFCAKSSVTSKSMMCPLLHVSSCFFHLAICRVFVIALCGRGLDLPCTLQDRCHGTFLKSDNSFWMRLLLCPFVLQTGWSLAISASFVFGVSVSKTLMPLAGSLGKVLISPPLGPLQL